MLEELKNLTPSIAVQTVFAQSKRSKALKSLLVVRLGRFLFGACLALDALALAGARQFVLLRNALLELLDALGGVDQLLVAGIEGVAGAAQFDFELLFGRAGRKAVAAGAGHRNAGMVGRVDIFFHKNDSVVEKLRLW